MSVSVPDFGSPDQVGQAKGLHHDPARSLLTWLSGLVGQLLLLVADMQQKTTRLPRKTHWHGNDLRPGPG